MRMTDAPNLSVSFLIEQIGPYITINPNTGAPRLIEGLNAVWDAVNELGGVAAVATKYDVEPWEVEQWIDDHYVPLRKGLAICKELRIDPIDFYDPSTGFEDKANGIYWPYAWSPDIV